MEHDELRCEDPDEQKERLHGHLLMLISNSKLGNPGRVRKWALQCDW